MLNVSSVFNPLLVRTLSCVSTKIGQVERKDEMFFAVEAALK